MNHEQDWLERCEALAQQNERLTVKVAALVQQNGYLRKANKVRPHVKLVEKANAAAKLLALWHCSGWLTGRESCTTYGMKESAFYAGRALLMLANLHDGANWLTDDADQIEARLTWALAYARKEPSALALNMPNSRRPRAYRSAVNAPLFGRW